jgi:type I restriction enzyme M protein
VNCNEKGADAIEFLKHNTFYGQEKESMVYPLTLANMVLHGIEQPSVWHGNTLTGNEVFGGLFAGAPSGFDIVLTNHHFGGKEGKAESITEAVGSLKQILSGVDE